MDTITSLVGVLETALEGGEPTTSLSSLNALYALYALQNRAEAAEAENARLREQVAALRAAVTRSRMMMDFNEFVGALRSAGWYSKADAQHRHIRVVWETLIARAEAAEAEAVRQAVMLVDAQAEAENARLREQVATLTANRNDWQPAIGAPFGQTVLAHYRNRLGKTRIVRATRVAKHTLLDEYNDDDADYDDITCEYYRPSGWYERLENGDYDYFGIDGIVTHYMPLPSIPEVHDGDKHV